MPVTEVSFSAKLSWQVFQKKAKPFGAKLLKALKEDRRC